jgi:hypothetical protein
LCALPREEERAGFGGGHRMERIGRSL